MSESKFNEDVIFVFYMNLTDSIGRRTEAEYAQAAAHGYAIGSELPHEFEQDDCDVKFYVAVPPSKLDDFQEFMEDVGVDPSYTVCTDEKDAYHAQKCGWNGNLLSEKDMVSKNILDYYLLDGE